VPGARGCYACRLRHAPPRRYLRQCGPVSLLCPAPIVAPLPPYTVIKDGVVEQQLPAIEEACQLADSFTVGEAGSIQIRDDETNTVVAERQWPPSDTPALPSAPG
jgi:hypothetical protein